MALLSQFLLRLAFGLSFGMAITTSRQVSSGFFRNHLYVTLGLTTLAAMASFSVDRAAFWYTVAAAVASYVGSVCWLYERKDLGKATLFIVALSSLTASVALLGAGIDSNRNHAYLKKYFPTVPNEISKAELSRIAQRDAWMDYSSGVLLLLSNASSGLLMGLTLAAMLLGHWYLNSPTMELVPLRRLLLATAAAIAFQFVVSALGLAGEINYATEISKQWLLFLLLRWSFGLVGVAVLVWMAWQTLKIPNTQSATGILFVAVIASFVGEMTSLLLSAESAFPL